MALKQLKQSKIKAMNKGTSNNRIEATRYKPIFFFILVSLPCAPHLLRCA
jgi:hypothetical protein